MGNLQFLQIFDEKSTALRMVKSESLKVLKKKIDRLLYQNLFNIKTNKVMKNEVIRGFSKESCR